MLPHNQLLRITLWVSQLFLCVQLFAQEPKPIYLWNGFQHEWTYNHRINRIGNYYDDATNEIVYTSASGLGADSTYFTSRFQKITSQHLSVYYGKVRLELEGKEGETISQSNIIENINIQPEDKGKKVWACLNGFDLLSLRQADKLELFSMELQIPEQESTSDSLLVPLEFSAAFRANCSTLECAWFKNKVHYQLDIYYVLLLSDTDDCLVPETNPSTTIHFEWDKETEMAEENPPINIMKAEKAFPKSVLGLQAVFIELDSEHWIKEWHWGIKEQKYSSINSKMYCVSDLYFKEWSARMKKQSAYPKHSRFSKRGGGDGQLKIKVGMFQFKEGKIESMTYKGGMFWKGRNQSATTEAAVSRMHADTSTSNF